MQLMIDWLIKGGQMDSCVGTRKTSALGRGCFTSCKLLWDLDGFTFYRYIRGRFTWENLVDVTSSQQRRSRPTHSSTLMQPLTIFSIHRGSCC